MVDSRDKAAFYGKANATVSLHKDTTMAELNMPQGRGKRKLSTPRIDLTPMVDLGFLLITFFMYTTTLAKPATMEIKMPYTGDADPTPVAEESVITLIPTKDHRVVYYEGFLTGFDQLRQCPISNLRSVMLKKKSTVAALPASFSARAHKVFAIIKPADDCTYGDVVQLIDEMLIDGIADYAIVDVAAEEKDALQKKF